ncbi:adenylyltransferase/cytidyltransferase family protein [Candidatus Microgenomates bacterium]|nr:adenylyltransferase/cytidyltransferase family protein [Candidatus Microgenomates bacterium]
MKTPATVLNYSSELQISQEDGPIVLVGGCFDVLHFGHLQFLNAAKKAGKRLVVALESDEFIKSRKARTPIHTQEQRAEMLSSLESVDCVVLLPFLKTDDEYSEMVTRISPSVIAVTQGDPQLTNKKRQAARLVGTRVVVVTPVIGDFSTSKIINQLRPNQ